MGNIALIERGDKTFAEKTRLAQEGGAVAAVIFNNEAGNFSGTLGEAGNWIPVVSLAREDGLLEKALGIHPVTLVIGASDYDIMEGTSMAAPYVCGTVGLLAALYPTDAMLKRIARIYSASDRLASLDKKVKTGGRLNLARSLERNLLLILAVFRQQVNIWVLKKDFAQVYFSVENDPGSGVSGASYGIYRSSGDSGFEMIKEVAASELQNNSYTYYDKYLDRGVAYTYLIQARNAQGEVIASSTPESI
ncbi:MAG: S8 family serine peptidase [Candidatus Aminicenantes bacterium]|nr:S8 family serine peptidase [Candidatus Aminicenantes bacterium]